MSRFKDQGFVVTGGASGIGEATTRGLVAGGGRVIIADLQADRGEALAEELGSARGGFVYMQLKTPSVILAGDAVSVIQGEVTV